MPRRYPTPYQQRTLWNAATGLSIVLLGAMIVGLVWLSGKIFGYLQPVLVPLAVAGIVAYLLDPIVTWLQGKGLSRLRAVIATFCVSFLALCVGGLIVVPPIAREVSELASDRQGFGEATLERLNEMRDWPIIAPVADWAFQLVDEEGQAIARPQIHYGPDGESLVDANGTEVTDPTEEELRRADNYRDLLAGATFSDFKIGYYVTHNIAALSDTGVNWLKGGTSRFLSFLGYLIGFALVPIYLFYFLRESYSIKANWHNYVPLRSSKFKDEVVDCVSEINGYLLAFFRGQVLVAFIDGILIGVALMIFQLPYALVIGLAMAILGIIPFVGNILCLIPTCIIAYVHFSSDDPNHRWLGDSPWAYVGVVVAIFVVAQQINSLFTAPKIVGDSVGLHPMTVIFSMLFWSIPLGGFLGALLAVPLTAAVKVLIRRYVWQRRIHREPGREPADPEPA